jgi:tetrahydromethanopterin S-methyltransferase subunit B
MTTLSEEVRDLNRQVAALERQVNDLSLRLAMAEATASDVKGLRRGAYWIAGLIVAGAIGFGFSVLALIPS